MKNLRNCILLLCILTNKFNYTSIPHPTPAIPRLVRSSRHQERAVITLRVYPAQALNDDNNLDPSYRNQFVLMGLTEAATNVENAILENTTRTPSPRTESLMNINP